jgi:hypothetical protein
LGLIILSGVITTRPLGHPDLSQPNHFPNPLLSCSFPHPSQRGASACLLLSLFSKLEIRKESRFQPYPPH